MTENCLAPLENKLLPDRLKVLWNEKAASRSAEDCYALQTAWTAEYAALWADALCLPGETGLKASFCRELSVLTGNPDLGDIERRCRGAMLQMKKEWEDKVRADDAGTVVEYYDRSREYAYELMWWHTLEEDHSPLAYVCALHLAVKQGARSMLDFGSGVGSGALLFARHGISVALADISSALLDFARRRLAARSVPAAFFDLKTQALPDKSYDFITAMDVFEHIAEPEETIDSLARALRPGGILFGRFSAEIDDDRPSHIARDFGPTFRRLEELGFRECWRDEWLWGHQAFCKPAE